MTSEKFDFVRSVSLKKTVIIAATPRSGSTFLCLQLWGTGVCGAPWEYFGFNLEMPPMWDRLKPKSHRDYLSKVMERRTSSNGVFSMKIHFHQLERLHKESPDVIDQIVNTASFIYIERSDSIAQAISLAKALQNGNWSSLGRSTKTVNYDGGFIEQCLAGIRSQCESWERWFEENAIVPVRVVYEEMIVNPRTELQRLIRELEIDKSHPDTVLLPALVRQRDTVSSEWEARYLEQQAKS